MYATSWVAYTLHECHTPLCDWCTCFMRCVHQSKKKLENSYFLYKAQGLNLITINDERQACKTTSQQSKNTWVNQLSLMREDIQDLIKLQP